MPDQKVISHIKSMENEVEITCSVSVRMRLCTRDTVLLSTAFLVQSYKRIKREIG